MTATAQVRSTVRRRVSPKQFCPPTKTGYASATQQEADKEENRAVRAEDKARKARDAERLRELAGERLRCPMVPAFSPTEVAAS